MMRLRLLLFLFAALFSLVVSLQAAVAVDSGLSCACDTHCGSSYLSGSTCYYGNGDCVGEIALGCNLNLREGSCNYDSSASFTDSCDGSTAVSAVTCSSSGVAHSRYNCNNLDGCYGDGRRDYGCSSAACSLSSTNTRCDSGCAANACPSGYTCNAQGECVLRPQCTDGDGDQYGTGSACLGTDCNDADATVHANNACGVCAAEPSPAPGGSCSAGQGACLRAGTYQCGAAGTATYCSDSSGNVLTAGSPGTESCSNGVDDDCDGSTDCGDASCAGNSACSACGNGNCQSGESCTTCPADCGQCPPPRCGDGAVTAPETCEPGVTAQPTCPDGSSQTCSPTSCTWNDCPTVQGGCRSNAECTVATADQCRDLKTVDRSVGGYCTASHNCQYQYSCVSGSCGAQCSLGSYSNVGCGTGFTKNCNSGCSWGGCTACADSDGDGFYSQGGCGSAVDCNDGNAAYTTSCPAAAGGGYCGDGTCQSTESQYSCPSDCRVAIQQTCSDGLRNQNEAGVDCGGVCTTTAVEVCNGADDNKNCLVDEGEVCNPCVSPVVVADADTSKACCLYRGFKWGRSGELSIPGYDVKVDNYAAQESGYVGGEVAGTDNNVYKLQGVLSGYASFFSQSNRLQWRKDLASLLSANTRDRFYTPASFPVSPGSYVYTTIKIGGTFYPSRIVGTPDNGVVVVGIMGGTGSTSSWEDKSQDGVLVAKLDSAGNLVWKAYWRGVAEHWRFGLWNPDMGLFGGQDSDGFGNEYFGQFDLNENYKYSFEAPIVAVNAAGEFLVTGRMRTASWQRYCIEGHPYYGNCPNLFRVVYGVSDYLIKISGSGQIVSSTVTGLFNPSGLFSYSSFGYPQAADVAYAPGTGGFYAVGPHNTYYGNTARSTYILSKISPGLNVEWNAFEPISQNFRNAMSVAYDANLNRVVVVGSGKNTTAATMGYSVWVHEPLTGRVVSRFSFDTPADDQAFDVMVDADGGYVVAGTAGIVKFDNRGRKLWNKTTGSAAKSVRRLSSGQNKLLVGVAAADYPLKTVEANVLVDAQNAYGQFADSAGERKAGRTMLGLDGELCVGDDASELFFLRSRQCDAGVCSTDVSDAVVCDKASDCVFQGRCYSDVDRVAATYFGNDRARVWGSVWKPEVAADVDADGQLELCDPGQWFEPTGSVVGFVKDAAGTGLDAATVRISGTSYSATSVAGGAYAVNSVFPGSYDFVASKVGYFDNASQTGIVVVPVTPTSVNFTLVRAVATVSGTVTNVSGDPVAGAVVSIVGTVFNTLTGPDGRYSLPGVQPGFYDLAAGKDSDGYGDSLVFNRQVSAPETAADFVLLKALEGCSDDCTKIGGNLCDAGCHGKGSCWFYSEETKQACDGTFGIISISGGRQVGCCEGRPYTPIKADVTIRAKEIIKTVKPVVYHGKLVKLITLIFTPER